MAGTGFHPVPLTLREGMTLFQRPALSPVRVRALVEVFRSYGEIQAVYVFGSTVSGTRRARSDLDLGILAGEARVSVRKLEILAELARRGFDNVDLVLLDRADLVVRYEAIRQNCLVYSRADFQRGAVYSKVVRQYLDLAPYLKRQRDAYKQRILRDQA
jgi:hypothetical protein